jgi:hypothetical protein
MKYYVNAFTDGSDVWIFKYDTKRRRYKEFGLVADTKWSDWEYGEPSLDGAMRISKSSAKAIVRRIKKGCEG